MTNDSSLGGPRSVVAGNKKDGRDGLSRRNFVKAEARPSNGSLGNGHDRAWPSRKTPAHRPVVGSFNRSVIVFLTVCSDRKRKLFAHSDIHDLFRAVWGQGLHWLVGRYVIMPDHIHLFCSPGRLEYPSLSTWIQYWKSQVSRQWPRSDEQPIWQKSFWDTQLRRGENYTEKWEYVRWNPVRAGLCADPEEWSLQGEMNVLPWHD